jgi:D-glycero-D-manno-heptose 1,7-bisphosphate phosphatase
MGRSAVFLDRDHTLIEDPGYLGDPDKVRLLPGVELAVQSLSRAGYLLVVVTNQSGVARGLITVEQVEAVHEEIQSQLSRRSGRIDAFYYCPYHPEGKVEEFCKESDLRKPKPGMLLQAARELDIDLERSWMVGDSARDIEAGKAAGVRTVRVRRPGDSISDDSPAQTADHTVRNLVDAARTILRADGKAPARTAPASRASETTEPSQAPATVAADASEESKTGGGVVARAMSRARAAQDEAPAPETTGEPDDAPRDGPHDELDDAPDEPRALGIEVPRALDRPGARLGLADEQDEAAFDDMEPTRTSQLLHEILDHVRSLDAAGDEDEFSTSKMLAGVAQMLAVGALAVAVWHGVSGRIDLATFVAVAAATLQGMALTLYVMHRAR